LTKFCVTLEQFFFLEPLNSAAASSQQSRYTTIFGIYMYTSS